MSLCSDYRAHIIEVNMDTNLEDNEIALDEHIEQAGSTAVLASKAELDEVTSRITATLDRTLWYTSEIKRCYATI